MVIVAAVFILAIRFAVRCRLKNCTPPEALPSSNDSSLIGCLTLLVLHRVSWTCFCCAAVPFSADRDPYNFSFPPSPSSASELLKLQPTASQAGILTMATTSYGEATDSLYILRNNLGDSFFDIDQSWLSCSLEKCSRRSSGTATVALDLSNVGDGRKLFFDRYSSGDRLCYCRCLPNTPIFREDLHVCVNDIHECPLVTFVSGNTQQKIPYVFLPLKGQIIHPNAEIKFNGLNSVPTCLISRVRYLSRIGWIDVKNYSIAEYQHEYSTPFKLFHDKHRTFLQWLGNTELRTGMEGRVVLIDLICKDSDSQLIFTPCISFRVAGVPSSSNYFLDHIRNPNASLEKDKKFSSNEYVALGLAALLIGLIYVASVFLYLRFKKNKLEECSARRNNAFKQFVDMEDNASHMFGGEVVGASKQLIVEEEGLVKNNPLLMKRYHSPTAQIHKPSKSTDAVGGNLNAAAQSDATGANSMDKIEVYSNPATQISQISELSRLTTGIVHSKPFDGMEPRWSIFRNRLTTPFDGRVEVKDKSSSRIVGHATVDANKNEEKHPDENISIVECPEDVIQANSKHKLYFNPAYLEPELLLAPPPAAVEFLLKIREIMTIAKRKISTKKFFPSLTEIPEENHDDVHETPRTNAVRPIEMIHSKAEVTGSSGIGSNNGSSSSSNGDDNNNDKEKRQIIQKWLQGIPKTCSILEATAKITSSSGVKNLSKYNASPSDSQQEHRPSKVANILQSFVTNPNTKQRTPDIPVRPKRLQQALMSELTTRKRSPDEVKAKLDNSCSKNLSVTTSPIAAVARQTENRDVERKRSELSSGAATLNSGLPLDEELTMQNTIYNIVTGSTTLSKLKMRYESGEGDSSCNHRPANDNNVADRLSAEHVDGRYSLVSEVYVNDGFSSSSNNSVASGSLHSSSNSLVEQPLTEMERQALQPASKYQESSRLMIQLTDCPFFYSMESCDDFEPDTLDRKPSREETGSVRGGSNHSLYSKFVDSLERPAICLRTHGSFRNDSGSIGRRAENLTRSFGSLQEIYQQRRKVDVAQNRRMVGNKCLTDDDAPHSLSPQVESFLWRKDHVQPPRHFYRQRKLSPPPPLPSGNDELPTQRSTKPSLPPRHSETKAAFGAHSLHSGMGPSATNSCLGRTLWSYRPDDSGYLSSSESERSQKLPSSTHKGCNREKNKDCLNVLEAAIKFRNSRIANGVEDLDDDDDDDEDDDDSMASFNDANSESGAESTATNFKFYKNNGRIASEA